MDGMGLVIFLVLMFFSVISKGKKKKSQEDYDYDNYDPEVEIKDIPPQKPMPETLPRETVEMKTQTPELPRKVWDIPPPKGIEEEKPVTAFETEILEVLKEQETELAKWEKIHHGAPKENIDEEKNIQEDKIEKNHQQAMNWQQAMILSQILSEPKSKKMINRYCKKV